MYAEPNALDTAIALHRPLGVIVQVTSPTDFLDANPDFNSAAQSGHLT